MKLKVKWFALLAALCVLLCGCMESSVENLLSPPKLLDEQDEIYRELVKSVGQNVKLKYPQSGDYRSAFVMYNLDDEPGDEAIVFYESKSTAAGENSLRLKIFDKLDGKYKAVYDLACAGSEVESISFRRLGTNSEVNIIVRYTLLNQSEKVFSVYSYNDRTPTERYSSTYVCLDVFDINNDGSDELITVSFDKSTQTPTAMMFTDGENGFEKVSQTDLYGGTGDYTRVTKGNIDEKTPALFLDYSKGGVSGTDVLYCADNQLLCPYGVGNTTASFTIQRVINDYMSDIFCYDIDGDGFVEVPNTKLLPGYETADKNQQLYATEWYTVAYSKFVAEHYSYVSSKYRFALLFPSRWTGVVTARADFQNNEIVFIPYDEWTGVDGENAGEVLRIRAVDKNDSEGMKAARELIYLGESDETYYCVSLNSGRLALTESELKNCFKIL